MTRSTIIVALALALSRTALGQNDTDADPRLPLSVEHSSIQKKMQEAFQQIADDNAGDSSIQIAFANKDFVVSAASGKTKSHKGRDVTTDDKYPTGSVVKQLTAASIMSLHDAGRLNIDDPMYKYVDPYFKSQSEKKGWKHSWSSLKELYGSDVWDDVKKVTIRDLLSMTAPVPNFNEPGKDLIDVLWPGKAPADKNGYMDPFSLIEFKSEGFWPFGSNPEQGGKKGKDCSSIKGFGEGWQCYSSSTYVMLGFILAADQGVSPEEMDQGKILPSYVRKHMSFGLGELTSDFTDVHAPEGGKDWFQSAGPMVGWTASNSLASASTYSCMTWEIYSPNAQKPLKSASEMAKPVKHKIEISGIQYGLGTMIMKGSNTEVKLKDDWGELYGHEGESYGYNGRSLYNPKMDASISVLTGDDADDYTAICLAWNTAINLIYGLDRKIGPGGNKCKPDPVVLPDPTPSPKPGDKTPSPTPSPKPSGGSCPKGTTDYGEYGGCGCFDDFTTPWHKAGKPSKGCDGKKTQCDKKNDDGESAYEGCADSCTPQDSTSWVQAGSTKGRGCAYLAKHGGDCGKKGEDGVRAYEACPRACGCPAARDYVIKHNVKKSTLTQLAAKLGDAAEGSVAVRVPTLVAVCVLAGVALGAVATQLAPTAKQPTEREPLLAVSKTESFGL